MKKYLSICSVVFLLLFMNAAAKTDDAYDEYGGLVSKLSAFSIIDSTEYGAEDTVTRGEFAQILVNAMDLAGVENGKQIFADVTGETPGADSIALLYELNIINGHQDMMFYPDNPVTPEQAYKMIMIALGYRRRAENSGGYPMGYMICAEQAGVTDDVVCKIGEPATMSTIVRMVDNALNAPMLVEEPIGSGNYKKDVNSTLFSDILRKRNLIVKYGLVTGNRYGSFLGENVMGEGLVEVDGKLYKTSSDEVYRLTGYNVEYYVEGDDGSAMPTVYFAEPESEGISSMEINRRDISSTSLSNIKYYDEKTEKLKTAKLNSNCRIIFNGKPVYAPTNRNMIPVNGGLHLVDENGDGEYDIVKVSSCEYFEAERVSVRNNAVFLKDETFNGLKAITMDYEEDDFFGSIVSDSGEKAEIEDIKANDIICVYSSPDYRKIDIRILRSKQEATVTEFDKDENFLVADGVEYSFALDRSGKPLLPEDEIIVGRTYSFVIGTSGDIVFMEEVKELSVSYGYVIDTAYNGAFGDDIQCKVVTADKEVVIYSVADSVILNSNRVKKKDFPVLKDCLVQYSVDENGNICRIDESEAYGGYEKKQYNEETGIFSSLSYNDAIFTNDETIVFVIPDSREDDDFKTTIRLNDKDKYPVQAYDRDEQTSAAGAVLVYMNVSYDTPGFIDYESPIGVLESVSAVYDEYEGDVYKLRLVSEGEQKTLLVKNTAELKNIVRKMCIADVFLYSMNSLGYIDNIVTIAEFVPMPAYYHTGMMSPSEMVFGLVYEEEGGILAKGTKTSFVNCLKLKTDADSEDFKTFLLSADEEIYYYLYDSSKKTVDLATFDDVKSEISFGGDASKVFIYSADNEPRVVLIVE